MYKSQGRQESFFFFFFLNEAHVTMIKHREVGVLRFFFLFFFPFVWSGGGVCVLGRGGVERRWVFVTKKRVGRETFRTCWKLREREHIILPLFFYIRHHIISHSPSFHSCNEVITDLAFAESNAYPLMHLFQLIQSYCFIRHMLWCEL